MEFAAHIRDPNRYPRPADVEPRRMQIYVDLIYNTIERFLANTFRVIRSIVPDAQWHAMVRDFVHRHRSASPYFQEIPLEFLGYLEQERRDADDPPWLLELAHYEWVELALDVETTELSDVDADDAGDLLTQHPVVSPLAWLLSYRFPVHRISPRHTPTAPPAEPTFLIVYRNREYEVKFMEANQVTARLFTLLMESDDITGSEAIAKIADELPGHDRDAVMRGGRETLERLRDCAIIAGTRRSSH